MSDEFTPEGIYRFRFPEPDFPCTVTSVNAPQIAYPLHGHRFTEMVVILRGTGEHLQRGVRTELQAGQVFVIPPDDAHAYLDVREVELYNILFTGDLLLPFRAQLFALPGYHALFTLEPGLRRQAEGEAYLRLSPAQLNTVRGMVEALQAEGAARRPGYRAVMLSLLVQLIVFCARCYQDSGVRQNVALVRLGRVLSYLEAHYREPLTLAELAEAGSMSERTLLRQFRQATGVSPIDYLLRLRITEAQHLLAAGDASVTEVAQAVGITDGNYFTRVFRQRVGMSPRAYRSQAGAG